MGSFCISCGVSGQVIADDDKCVVLPVIQQSTFEPVEMTLGGQTYSLLGVANSTCHPGSHGAPKGGFVTGTYADYGCICPDDTVTNRRVMVEFFVGLVKNSPVVEKGSNSCHDIPFDIKAFIADKAPVLKGGLSLVSCFDSGFLEELDFDELVTIWNYVWECTQEHRLFCRDGSGRIRPVQFAAFHSVSFRHLVEYAMGLKGWNDEPYELGAFLKRQLTELEEKEVDASEDKKFFLRLRVRDRLTLNMSDSVNSLLYPFLDEHFDLLDKYLDERLEFEDYVEAMRPSMEGVYALKGMSCLNLKFSPIVYAGQDYDNSQGRAIAKLVSSISKDINKERKKRRTE